MSDRDGGRRGDDERGAARERERDRPSRRARADRTDGDDPGVDGSEGEGGGIVDGLLAGGSTKPLLALIVLVLLLMAFGFLVAGLLVVL